jgi:hypothetical protein
MIEPKDISKMVAHIVRRDSGIPDASIMHPMREWVLGLAVVFLLVVAGMVFNVLMYRAYHDELSAPLSVEETVVPYKAALVAHAISYYEAERKTYESLLGTHSMLGEVSATIVPPIATSSDEIATSSSVASGLSTTSASTADTTPKVPEVSVPPPQPAP